MQTLLFEDDAVEQLWPITLGRTAHAVTCGGTRLASRLATIADVRYASTRPYLQKIQRENLPGLGTPPAVAAEPLLLVNSRLVPSDEVVSALQELANAATTSSDLKSAAICRGGELLAACLASGTALPGSFTGSDVMAWLSREPIQTIETTNNLSTFQFPHDVIAHHPHVLNEELERRIGTADYNEIADGVFIGPDVSLADYLVTDSRQGPIVIESGATIGAFSVIKGPVLIERGACVNEHAVIKEAVAIGHTTKIGGEVEASIIEPLTNKQHHGFLGHSYVGSWVNLGAGTCNSDLKNTYGTIRIRYGDKNIDTQSQLVGAIIGDYVKTAINASIFTGKTIGPCSMLYGTIAENVAPFVNYAKQLGSVTEITPDVIISMQQRMFARRDRQQQEADRQLIRDMFDRSVSQRGGLAAGPPQLAGP